jgi:4-amino-4-deoxy-L-arabinose transferase-like glycosyltransferase
MKSANRQPLVFWGVAVLLLVIVLQLVLMARDNSATFDEPFHIYAGYLQWKHGYVLLNPPLITSFFTLPLLGMNLPEPPITSDLPGGERTYDNLEFQGGKALVFQNDTNAILFRTRMTAMVFTVVLALLVFAAARDMFGVGAGLIALGLMAFDPTLMGHSALATLDAGNACLMFWAIYAFYRYVKSPTAWRLIATGVIVGLALAAKHSAILLFPTMGVLAIIEVVWRGKLEPELAAPPVRAGRHALCLALALAVIFAISMTILWGSYGFRYAPGDAVPFNPPMKTQLDRVPSALEGRLLGEIDGLHLLPAPYTYAFANILRQAKSYTSYLMGVAYPHAVWFYFPITLLIKSSLTFLILLVISAGAVAIGAVRLSRGILYMGISALVFMAFAVTGGMNIGVRHILPVYVFLSVPIAGASWSLMQRNRSWIYAVVALLVFQAGSVLHAYPAYISYTNEVFGGPANSYKYVSDSSSEWGQQLNAVRRYVKARGIKNCWFAYFNQAMMDFRSFGIPCTPLLTAEYQTPDTPPAIDGTVLISAAVLSGFETGTGPLNPYGQFQKLKPAAVIDYGVFVYDGHFEIPLAAALRHVQKAAGLLSGKNAPDALSEARQAEALAPDSAAVNDMLGQAAEASGQPDDAARYYQKALTIAKSMQPGFQEARIADLEKRLGAGKQGQ